MNKFIVVCLLAVLLSCGVKKRDAANGNGTPLAQTSLPYGIFLTPQKKFFVAPSTSDFKPNEENTISYRMVGSDLRSVVSDPTYTFDINYDMPTMPAMHGPWKATNVRRNGEELSATYLIVHGGPEPWVFTIRISKNGALVDTLVYSVTVKE